MKRKQLFSNDEIDLLIELLNDKAELLYDLYKLDELTPEDNVYWTNMVYSLIDRLEAMKNEI